MDDVQLTQFNFFVDKNNVVQKNVNIISNLIAIVSASLKTH